MSNKTSKVNIVKKEIYACSVFIKTLKRLIGEKLDESMFYIEESLKTTDKIKKDELERNATYLFLNAQDDNDKLKKTETTMEACQQKLEDLTGKPFKENAINLNIQDQFETHEKTIKKIVKDNKKLSQGVAAEEWDKFFNGITKSKKDRTH